MTSEERKLDRPKEKKPDKSKKETPKKKIPDPDTTRYYEEKLMEDPESTKISD